MTENGVIPYEEAQQVTVQYTAPKEFQEEMAEKDHDPLSGKKTIYDKESGYARRKYDTLMTPEALTDRTYKEAMEHRRLDDEEKRVLKEIEENNNEKEKSDGDKTPPRSRKRRWDVGPEEAKEEEEAPKKSRWEDGGEILDKLLPPGYEIIEPPSGYSVEMPDLYTIPEESSSSAANLAIPDAESVSEKTGVKDLQFFKEHDLKYFGELIEGNTKGVRKTAEARHKEDVGRLLLQIKNGTPQARKIALRILTQNSKTYGPAPLFDTILPLLMEKSLDETERHLLVKIIGRILFKLQTLVRPYTHKILVVIMPLLIDEDYFAREQAREIIANLARASGLPHMISTLRPDIDHPDDYVRNTVARTLAVVSHSLGIPAMVPFLKAVCSSKKSWRARHTGLRIVQHTARMLGSGVLPHLPGLVSCAARNIGFEVVQVRSMACMAVCGLAEAAKPYGIECFEPLLDSLWSGVRSHRGKNLASFLQAIGSIIPLMEEEHANLFSRDTMRILQREFSSPDEEMKRTCLSVLSKIVQTNGVSRRHVMDCLDRFFASFFQRRTALDRRLAKQCVATCVALSDKVGVAECVTRITPLLKDESEPLRRMSAECVFKIVELHSTADLEDSQVDPLLDAALIAFQETSPSPSVFGDRVTLRCLSQLVTSLGLRAGPHLTSIVSTALYRIGNRAPEVREQAADLISLIAPTVKMCGEELMVVKLGSVLYESLGESYPEVLGSILSALCAIVSVVGVSSTSPPIGQILPTLTPILRNRHEKVQAAAVAAIGTIAVRAPEYVNAREWMRICFELLELLKTPKKQVRVAANATFGHIARAIGPQDVLATLLNNLKVQERQLRVCTAVAIGIVAETCSPFTVLPALMNEYRAPEKNVQNGVLKSLSFMFEYVGHLGKDYVYACAPLLQDALTDRDQVHRQTAASVVRHLALGNVGAGLEDCFVHFLNLLWPNIFETSPHVIDRILEGVEACRVVIGPGAVMGYILAGLFHAARSVRTPYWRVYNSMYIQSCDSMVAFFPKVEGVVEDLGKEWQVEPIGEFDMW